jgi:translocation and assembly module TamA
MRFFTFILLLYLSSFPLFADSINYDVRFEGVRDKEILDILHTVSQLVTLQDSPPSTVAALRRRADGDIPQLIHGLRTFGYYNGKVDIQVDTTQTPAHVIVAIDTGPIYPLAQFQLLTDPSATEACDLDMAAIDLKEIGITLHSPALPSTIMNAETSLLRLLMQRGYPLANITKRDVVADQAEKALSVTLYVDSGPHAYFGPLSITGCTSVDLSLIRDKITWATGDSYDLLLVEQTQAALEECGLFSSVTITHAEECDELGLLPIDICVLESYHRTIGFGASYTTQLGLGITAEWEHRNWHSLGQKIALQTQLWQRLQAGRFLYLIPDFYCRGQNLIWLTEAEHVTTRGFTEAFISFSGILNRRINETTEISYGAALKELHSANSDNNRTFLLLKTPLQLKWNIANDLLNPTSGGILNLKLIPTAQFLSPQISYMIATLIGSTYLPLNSDSSFVLATKLSLGSIIGASRISIPPPERFYAGSENTLRGYNYLTVSPLNKDNKPIGGRSLLIYTFEPRWRIDEEFGLVAFYEVGNVYNDPTPQLALKQLQSIGVGLRYHTAIGPLRLDVAVPLNRRRGIDSSFQLYFSIGQAF